MSIVVQISMSHEEESIKVPQISRMPWKERGGGLSGLSGRKVKWVSKQTVLKRHSCSGNYR